MKGSLEKTSKPVYADRGVGGKNRFCQQKTRRMV